MRKYYYKDEYKKVKIDKIKSLLRSKKIPANAIKKVIGIINKYSKKLDKIYPDLLIESHARHKLLQPKSIVSSIKNVINVVSKYEYIGQYASRYGLSKEDVRSILREELNNILVYIHLGGLIYKRYHKKIKNLRSKKTDTLDTPKRRWGIYALIVKKLVNILNPLFSSEGQSISCIDIGQRKHGRKTISEKYFGLLMEKQTSRMRYKKPLPFKQKTFELISQILNIEFSDQKDQFTSAIIKARFYNTYES